MTTDTFDPTTVQLGKAPAKIDPRTLRLADFINPTELPSFPLTFKDSDKLTDWKMLGNDTHGDCVMAGDMHQEMLWSVLAGSPFTVNEQQLLQTYTQLSGGDNGLVILDYLKWRRKNPVAGARKMLGFAAVNWRDLNELQVAISMFHGVLRGILLPQTAQAQSSPSGTWDTVTLSGNGAPGSWGGHLTFESDYDPSGFGDITWAYVQRSTQRFMANYCDECFVVIPNYQIPGFDYSKFVEALKQIDPNANFDPPEPTPVPPPPPSTEIPHYESFIRYDQLRYRDGTSVIWTSTGKYDQPPV